MSATSEHATRLADLKAAVGRAQDAVRSSHATIQRLHRSLGRGPSVSTAAAFRTFSEILEVQGVRSALAYLGGLSDYRFVSIFRFKDGKATSAVHVDRLDPAADQAGEVADTATYCCYVRDGNGAFATLDATHDPRTAGHVARDAVPAYCGVPILTPEGELVGTLCHYDLVPRDPQQLDLELLLQVAVALSKPGLVPPYPQAVSSVG